MAGSPGSALVPAVVSILAEGDIQITGNPDLQPDSQTGFENLFVTDGDLRITGSLATPLIVEGVILVHGQLWLGGSPNIAGQILVENTPGAGTLIGANLIAGTPTITYNGTAGNDTFDIA